MRGLLFAVVYCAISLLFAEVTTRALIMISVIQPHEFKEVHGVIMLLLLALYMGFAPTFDKDFSHRHDEDEK